MNFKIKLRIVECVRERLSQRQEKGSRQEGRKEEDRDENERDTQIIIRKYVNVCTNVRQRDRERKKNTDRVTDRQMKSKVIIKKSL
jgi:hypothetical protein